MSQLVRFVQLVKTNQELWALQDPQQQWLVCESPHDLTTSVLPLWTYAAQAQQYCIDAWSDQTPTPIVLAEFIQQWLPQFEQQSLKLGIDWQWGKFELECSAQECLQQFNQLTSPA